MEHYTKGVNREEVLAKSKIPIDNLPDDFLWMKVSARSKVANIIPFALRAFKDETETCIVWSGSGLACEKAVACAQMMKKRCRMKLHQSTKICNQKVEEFWEPKLEGLDTLVVERQIPTIHILLSKEKIISKVQLDE